MAQLTLLLLKAYAGTWHHYAQRQSTDYCVPSGIRMGALPWSQETWGIRYTGSCANVDIELTNDTYHFSWAQGSAHEMFIEGMGEEKVFAVLGESSFASGKQVPIPAPKWIQNARTVSGELDVDRTPVEECEWSANLHPQILSTLQKDGVHYWFPVQKGVIPELLKDVMRPPLLPPRDICVSAPTGSGKTLSYVIPIVHALRTRLLPRTRALIMLPQSDLATQVYSVMRRYAEGTKLQVMLLTGQKDLKGEEASLRRCRHKPPDVVVATPGRLMDHLLSNSQLSLEDRYFRLDALRYLVIDEADRMMVDVRLSWLAAVETAVFGLRGTPGPRPRPGLPTFRNLLAARPFQKLLFSATLSQDPGLLAEWNLFQPKLFAVDKKTAGAESHHLFAFPSELSQKYMVCNASHKPLVLHHVLQEHPEWTRVLCFAGSKESSHRLRLVLEKLGEAGSVVELGAQLVLARRQRLIRRFRDGGIRVVISTDLAGRGLDVAGVSAVVNYDLPRELPTYAHRVGRTARAGQPGLALTLVEPHQTKAFKTMLKVPGHWGLLHKIPPPSEETLKPLMAGYRTALTGLKDSLQEEQGKRRPKRTRQSST